MLTLDIDEVLFGLERFGQDRMARAELGLRAAASEIETVMKGTTAHGDVTGATRAGYSCYVVTPTDSGYLALATAVAAVEAKNPGASATDAGTLAGDLGVIYTCPTNYQHELETENAGAKAVLGPNHAATRDSLTRRAAEGR